MSISRNTIANYIGQGWVALMGIAFLPVYIAYLGAEAFGLIGFYVMLSAFLPLLDMGLTPMIAREMARYRGNAHSPESIRDLLRSVEVVAAIIAVVVVAAGILVSEWLARDWLQAVSLPVNDVVTALQLMTVVIAMRLVEGLYRSALVGLEQQVTFNAINSAMATIRWLGGVGVVVWVDSTVFAFFAWQCAASLLSFAALAITTYSHLPPAQRRAVFSWEALRPVWVFSRGMLLITFLSLMLTQADKIILSRLLTLEDFAHYSLATTAAAGLFMLTLPVTQAWYPRLCQVAAQKDVKQEALIYHSGAQLISIVAGGTAVFLITHSFEILVTWTRNRELSDQIWVVLSLLSLGNMLNATMHIPYHVQLAHGWTSLTVRINLVAVATIVPSIVLGTYYFGIVGAAAAWACLNFGYVVFGIPLMHKRILTTEMRSWYLNDVSVPLTGAALGAALAKLFVPFPSGVLLQVLSLGASLAIILFSTLIATERTRSWALRSLQRRLAQN